jgi:regulator of sigma E protease
VNGHATPTFDAISRRIRTSDGRPITVTVRRHGQRVTLGPRRTIRSGDRWIWGFQPAVALASYPPGSAARRAGSDLLGVVTGTAQAVGNLFHGHERGQLTSAVGIVRVSAAVLKVSVAWYLQIVGLVSMSLAILNMIPLLPLDGGRVLFALVEGIRRRAVAREVYERVSVVGVAIMLMIAVIALSNDLSGAGPR